MFWNKKKEPESTIESDLEAINIMMSRLLENQKEFKRDLQQVKTHIDGKLRDELNTVERKYISFLEGKLIRFDEECAQIKNERERERYRIMDGLTR